MKKPMPAASSMSGYPIALKVHMGDPRGAIGVGSGNGQTGTVPKGKSKSKSYPAKSN
jgi:hypothetical protein